MTRKILTMNTKKVVPWGNGLAIYITKEARKLDWDKDTQVVLYVVEEDGKKKIEAEKAPVE